MIHDLITMKIPPPGRVSKTEGDMEQHFTEPAVMLAYAFHLFREDSNLKKIGLHPDGEHGKQFDIRSWLTTHGFKLTQPEGSTSYGGVYFDGERSIHVSLKPGLGKIVFWNDSCRM
jgi:hypothetical protein